jgi:polyisoprenoid-binding protein YceI
MKHNTIRIIAGVTFAAVMALFIASARAEQTLVYRSAEGSSLRLDGTSTAHRWTVNGSQIDGTIAFRVAVPAGASTEQIKRALVADPKVTAQVAIPARTLKGENKDMDKKMYEVLKTKEHPDIVYKLGDVQVAGDKDSNAAGFQLATSGELTIAGTTRTIDMPMTIEVLDGKHLKISARLAVKMSDYNVERPTALGGLIKAGDRVAVEVEWFVDRPEPDSAKQ